MFYFRYSANQILDKPNVYPKYGDSDRSWTQAGGQNQKLQYLEVSIYVYDLWYILLFWSVLILLCAFLRWGMMAEGENFKSVGFVPQMKFPRKIYVTSVNIYETLNAGAVVRISAKSPNDQWMEIFWTPQALHIKRARKFSPRIKVFFFQILFLYYVKTMSIVRCFQTIV